ncbi:acetylxylan esterase [Flaviflexus equikiangi]|uniref:Acetylxylan esterase n=2 Tax=Flaviflexus equikiangi TaxID=2758573 RepID=A0ABS2THQ3_9ACTO|nr:acetylxylan esterase [Flaviflexus equikiangi]MBM9433807.1 acetylxylan esterase [Flaviflexus equikiangi]
MTLAGGGHPHDDRERGVPHLPVADLHHDRVGSGGPLGELAIVSAALTAMRGRPTAATLADVPFLSNFERAIGLTDQYPYAEITDYLAVKRTMEKQVFETLPYFDVVIFSERAHGTALFSTGLMDTVAPPSTVFAT